MSLDETLLAVWELRSHPLAALVANLGAKALIPKVPEPARAAFADAHREIAAWYPARPVPILDLYSTTVARCGAAHAEMDDAAAKQPAVRALLTGFSVQITVLERHAPQKRTLPSGSYDIGEREFVAHMRDLAKLERHLELRQMDARLSVLLARASERGAKWDDVLRAAARQGWGRLGAPLNKLTPGTRALAEAIDLGATVEATDIGGRAALRVGLVDGSRRIAVLDAAERAALFAAVPWAEPAGA